MHANDSCRGRHVALYRSEVTKKYRIFINRIIQHKFITCLECLLFGNLYVGYLGLIDNIYWLIWCQLDKCILWYINWFKINSWISVPKNQFYFWMVKFNFARVQIICFPIVSFAWLGCSYWHLWTYICYFRFIKFNLRLSCL